MESDRRGFTLKIDGEPTLDFAADRPESVGSDAVSLGLLEIVRADADANGYLDPDEFPVAGLPGAPAFEDVDRDGDGQATRDEIRAYLEEDVRLAASRAYVLTEPTAAGLFGPLDADGDGRLTPRERAAAAESLAAGRFAADRDRDGTVRRSELVEGYAVRIGPGRPAAPDGGGMMREMESRRGTDANRTRRAAVVRPQRPERRRGGDVGGVRRPPRRLRSSGRRRRRRPHPRGGGKRLDCAPAARRRVLLIHPPRPEPPR